MIEIKKGAFGRPVKSDARSKKGTKKTPEKGYYMFRLIEEHTLLKPVDNKTNESVDNPFPPMYVIPNEGYALNPDSGELERWRYLHGYNSIWEKDQQNPEPPASRLNNFDGKNDLIFSQGYLKVRGNEEAKKQALEVQDIFDGIAEQIVPVPFVYTLIDDSKEESKLRNMADEAFEAESLARKASLQEMLAVAMAFGIDIQNAEEDEEKIKTKFIMKAKTDPRLFMRVYNDPRNKMKYLVTQAIGDGSIVVNEGVLSYNGVPMLSVRMDADIAEQVATQTIEGEEKGKQLIDTLKSLT